MAVTTGTKILTYPNSGTSDWYGTFQVFAQDITDYLDALEAVAELVNDTSPQLGGTLVLGGFDFNDENDNEMIDFTETANAVNHIQISNASTGNSPTISAVGGDSNINLALISKGTGAVRFDSSLDLQSNNIKSAGNVFTDGNNNEVLGLESTASAVNHIKITNAATGNAPKIEATGDDTNIDLIFQKKGTGKVIANSNMSHSADIALDADSTYDIGSSSNKLTHIGTNNLYFSGNTEPCTEQGLCKVWVKYDQFAASVLDSYQTSSVTDVATGKWTVNYSISISGSYLTSGGIFGTSGSYTDCYVIAFRHSVKAPTYAGVKSGFSHSGANFSYNDYDDLTFIALGDYGS